MSEDDGFVDENALAASGRTAKEAAHTLVEIASDPVDERWRSVADIRETVRVLGELADRLDSAGVTPAVPDTRKRDAVG